MENSSNDNTKHISSILMDFGKFKPLSDQQHAMLRDAGYSLIEIQDYRHYQYAALRDCIRYEDCNVPATQRQRDYLESIGIDLGTAELTYAEAREAIRRTSVQSGEDTIYIRFIEAYRRDKIRRVQSRCNGNVFKIPHTNDTPKRIPSNEALDEELRQFLKGRDA